MLRILLLFILGYVAWRAFKTMISSRDPKGPGSPSTRMDEDMVQDPQCGVYVTRQDAVAADMDGCKVYFCSRECKQKYIEARQAGRQ